MLTKAIEEWETTNADNTDTLTKAIATVICDICSQAPVGTKGCTASMDLSCIPSSL